LFQTLSRDRRQAAATNEEAVRYAHGQSAAAGAQDYSVETDPATAVATEEDSTPEGLPQPVGHPSSTPQWKPPALLSPLPGTPPRRPARVHRGIQIQPDTTDRAVQCAPQWETIDDDDDNDTEAIRPTGQESRGTQVEATPVERGIQTDSPGRSYTPPGTPPKLRRWGPRRRTTTRPSLEWRERL